jgi:hypothetical protein
MIGIACSSVIVCGSNGFSGSFGIDAKIFLYFRYGQNLPIAAVIFSHSYSHTSLGRAKHCRASSRVIVSSDLSLGIFAYFLSGSSELQIWMNGQNFPVLAITGFQDFGSSHSVISDMILSTH